MIEIKNLTRIYEYHEKTAGLNESIKALFKRKIMKKVAVDNFNLSVQKGEFVGLIGPNGAGKTTLIKMMTGIIRPTSGEITVAGYKPEELKDDFKKKYAVVMGQKSQLWWDLPACDSFLLNKEIYNIDAATYQKKVDYFVDLFEVKEQLNVQVRKLSLGQRMKMEIIASLLHDPEMIFLDEPTIGLDVIAQKQMRKFLKQINKETGVTIILTSHYMEDIKTLCDRVVIISKGSKIFDDTYEKLAEKQGSLKLIKVTFENPIDPSQFDFENTVECSSYKLEIKVDKKEVKSFVAHLFDTYEVEDISIEEEDIADTIEKFYNESR